MAIKQKMNIACVISGGKDGFFAYNELNKLESYNVKTFLNLYVNKNEVSFHQYRKQLVAMQAKAIGIPLIQKEVARQYENQELFKSQLTQIILNLKDSGIEGVCFGYILAGDCQDLLLRQICKEVGIKLILPNYKKKSSLVLEGIVNSGIKSIVTSVDPKKLPDIWLGREINEEFILKIGKIKEVDPCGDAGEYHSFVLDAPFFLKRLKLKRGGMKIFETKTFLLGEAFIQRNISLDEIMLVDK